MSGGGHESRFAEMSNNPPPPGTIDDTEGAPPNRKTLPDPYIKNPEYERYQRRSSRSPETHHRRGRHHHDRRRYSRSRSSSYERDRHHSRRKRDSRSSRRRRSHSSSRSRSPTPNRDRKSTRRSNSYERKPCKSRSRSASRERDDDPKRGYRTSRFSSTKQSRTRSKSPRGSANYEQQYQHYYPQSSKDLEAAGATVEEEDEADQPKENAFKNDGSFMAMFKKMQEEKERQEQADAQKQLDEPILAAAMSTSSGGGLAPVRAFPGIGKRRGGRVLKTGIVAKAKVEEDDANDEVQDAWSIYLKEVKRYKEACCDDDSKTRPLVK